MSPPSGASSTRQASATPRSSASTTRCARDIADASSRASGRARRADLGRSAGAGGVYVDRRHADRRHRRQRAPVIDLRRRRALPGRAQLAERRRRLRRVPRARASTPKRSPPALATFPGLAAPQGAGRDASTACASSTTARRPTPTPPPGARLLRRDLLDRRRPGQGRRHRARSRRSSPRIRHAFLIGEAARRCSPRRSTARCRHAAAATLATRSRGARAGARSERRAGRRRAAVAGLRLVRPVRRFRGARRRVSAALVAGAAGADAAGVPHDASPAPITSVGRPLVVDGRPLDPGRARRLLIGFGVVLVLAASPAVADAHRRSTACYFVAPPAASMLPLALAIMFGVSLLSPRSDPARRRRSAC